MDDRMTQFGAVECPHYHLVPKDFDANLRFRKSMLEQCSQDPDFAAKVKRMCEEDILFYVNTFCWTYDPRKNIRKLPFITYPSFQDEAILRLADAIKSGKDYTVPKSRAMGASWIGLTVLEWFWHFQENMDFGLISRTENYVDQRGNSKCLMWKIDFLHANQPKWLLPTGRHLGDDDPNRKNLQLTNADTGSTFAGESTTGDIFRGGRLTALFIDEFAAFEVNDGFRTLRATRDVTHCRIFNSTPQGSAGAFYEIVHNSAAVRLDLHWSRHPEYRKGLYQSYKGDDGEYHLELLDTEFEGEVEVLRKGEKETWIAKFPEEYPFILDGKLRSVWYDHECARCISEQEIAQELDIDFLGSEFQFFDPETIRKLEEKYCMPPVWTGDIVYDSATLEPLELRENPEGSLMLWFDPGHAEIAPVERSYVVGSDVSQGTGASNSVTSIADITSGEKVAVWRNPNVYPRDFADVTVALAKFFNNALSIWDASGPTGQTFTKRIIETGYGNIYYRKPEDRVDQTPSSQPGYFLNPDARASLLSEYRSALGDHKFVNRSRSGMEECLQFIVQPGGKVEHNQAANSQDPSGARTAHGDEAIADALANKGLWEKSQNREGQRQEPPIGSLAWRMQWKESDEAAVGSELGDGWGK